VNIDVVSEHFTDFDNLKLAYGGLVDLIFDTAPATIKTMLASKVIRRGSKIIILLR